MKYVIIGISTRPNVDELITIGMMTENKIYLSDEKIDIVKMLVSEEKKSYIDSFIRNLHWSFHKYGLPKKCVNGIVRFYPNEIEAEPTQELINYLFERYVFKK